MTENPIFRGAATALITPMTAEGVDYNNFEKVINWQIEQGIDALVIAGTGSNDTAYAIDLTKYCCSVGADAMLVVTPYYNKATQNGLIKMYNMIADASDKPLILYNVPSRTGVNIEPKTYAALAEHPMIQGIKEASGNISKIAETFQLVGDRLDIYSGNDDQVVPVMALGGQGVISVLSNVLPAETSKMCHNFLNGNTAESLRMQMEYLPFIKALFSETNPIPVKAAMADLEFSENYLRMPLTPMEDTNYQALAQEMRKLNII